MYDKNLIDINIKDSIIYVHKLPSLLEDTTTYIKVLCHNDPNLTDSVSLHIKKKLELPHTINNVNGKGTVDNTPTKHISTSSETSVTPESEKSQSSITPSNGTQNERTKIVE